MFKTFSRISACAALAVSFFLSTSARAQDAVIAIPSLNEVQAQVAAVAGKINPTFPLLVNMTLGQSAAFGIDGTKPIAVYANSSIQKNLSVVGFIPVKNQKMFDAQFEAMKEKGQIPDLQVESKDGYSILLFGQDWTEDLPNFKTPKMLNFKANPTIFLPLIDQQLAAAQLLQDDEQRETQTVNLERAKRNLKQLEEVAFSLDSSKSGDLELAFSAKPIKGTEIAENYAHTEQLTQSFLCGFFDSKAPFAVQFLGTFDENNRKDFVEGVTSVAGKVPEELVDVILKAMEVKKFDFACSFYPDKMGVFGIAAMGIANGEKINEAIEKAIGEIKSDSALQGKANAGKIGETIKIHEFTIDGDKETKKFAVAVHPKYLFVAVAPTGSSAVDYLKKTFKEKGFKVTKVKKNGQVHFDMEILSSFMKEIKPDSDVKYAGEVNYVADFSNGEFNGTLKLDGTLLETVGEIIAVTVGGDADADDDDLFGDDDDDDDDDDDN